MTATGFLDEPTVAAPRARRSFSPVAIVVVAIVLAVAGLGGRAWFQGGTHLRLDSAGLGVHTVPVGAEVSFGVGMTTHGGPDVVVESASADHSAQIDVRFSVLHTDPGELGVGTADGPIPGAIPLDANNDVKVAQPGPATGGTWLIATVTADQPGPWSITHIRVKYRSWLRTRTTTSGYVVNGDASP